ncbi:MAG: carboxypeptidase regulatory-like domain-containing protein [Acidobacteriaceae bacterium]|nr:carboxypeptidase regulatory-like domain-containing protein [Acidobacteriaceae bacterium]MBV9502576.1 carboxypeptidase regulatory-like domain-containing protein [Acidobacteriaceae bacterium]
MNRLALVPAFFVVAILFQTGIAASEVRLLPAAHVSANAQGQEPARTAAISGTVRTPQGVAVPGAAVRIIHVTSGRTWETSTDDEGKFSVRDLPAGHYRVEARQVGLGTALWENDIYNSSPATLPAPEQIELTLRRRAPVGKPIEAGVAAAAVGTSSNVAKSANKTNAATRPSANNQSQKADVASGQSDAGTKAVESKKDSFEQVEPRTVLTASSDPGQQVALSAPPASSANTQSISAESYLISGTVGRGSTAGAADTNDQDDSTGPEDADNNSNKHHHHSKSGHSKSAKAFVHAGLGDNLAGNLADLAVRDKVKHLGSNQVHLTLYNYYETSAWDARNYALTGVPAPMIAHFSERLVRT